MTPQKANKLIHALDNFLKERDEQFLFNDTVAVLLDSKLRQAKLKEFETVIGLVFSGKMQSEYERKPQATAKKVRDAILKRIHIFGCLLCK